MKGSSNFNITFGSWVGADKDGNPYVTTKVTKEALKIYSNQIISIYKEKIIELSDDFSVSTNFVDCPDRLQRKIKNAVFSASTCGTRKPGTLRVIFYRGIVQYRLYCVVTGSLSSIGLLSSKGSQSSIG